MNAGESKHGFRISFSAGFSGISHFYCPNNPAIIAMWLDSEVDCEAMLRLIRMQMPPACTKTPEELLLSLAPCARAKKQLETGLAKILQRNLLERIHNHE